VPRSQDLATGIGLLVATSAMKGIGAGIYEQVARGMTESLSGLAGTVLTLDTVQDRLRDWALLYVRAALPLCGLIAGAGLAFGLAQGQLNLSWKPLAPDFSRLNPLTGIARLFSGRTVVEQVKSLLKLTAIGLIGYRQVVGLLPQIPALLGQNVATAVTMVLASVLSGLQSIALAMVVLGGLDYGYQYWEFIKSVKMTKEEVKQEHKQQEGNPELKQKQRQRARELAMRRKALQAVPTADVIITNPTHYAIAIRYSAGKDAAPTVVAKGADLLAQRIKVIARQNSVPAVENRPLARTLYSTVDIDEVVPPELYQAVAEVLAFVYSVRKQERRPHSS
jgi:flagellar biosynthesis protein FlhB